jgi:hypothetical protein
MGPLKSRPPNTAAVIKGGATASEHQDCPQARRGGGRELDGHRWDAHEVRPQSYQGAWWEKGRGRRQACRSRLVVAAGSDAATVKPKAMAKDVERRAQRCDGHDDVVKERCFGRRRRHTGRCRSCIAALGSLRHAGRCRSCIAALGSLAWLPFEDPGPLQLPPQL